MSDQNKYLLFKYLDEETRVIGLPLDEFIPAVLLIAFGFFVKILPIGILCAIASVMFLKHLKKNRGKSALLAILYWHGNSTVGKTLFPSFPKSTERNFI